ncbi:MAG: endopeptidase La, partial [Pseudomonadales bacterium]|nr:endopeptidase La [Pseudomonadales bacterium]
LLPLRDVVVFPNMVIPLFVGRDKSIVALNEARETDKKVFLVAQKDAAVDDPGLDDLHDIGTIATLLQMIRLPDGTVKILVEGEHRAKTLGLVDETNRYQASVQALPENLGLSEERSLDTLSRSLRSRFEQFVQASKKIPSEVTDSVADIDDSGRLVDTIASHMALGLAEKQQILGLENLDERIEKLIELIEAEIDLIQIDKRIRGRVKTQMEKSQREYYLNEQMKAIQKEMGDLDSGVNDMEQYEARIKEAGMTDEAIEKAGSELNKLKMMSPMSAEASVVRGYLDWILGLPWKKRSKVSNDIKKAENILNEDHYGLADVKERVTEYLAVQKRVRKIKGPVICLVGPPGVGKTSLGESIARATNRKFVRMSLGGVRDEAEIRGHRRTYIGSMPGKLIQKMSKAGVKNPLFLLDEIDKMGMDQRGDPASALLEVLDPEQNSTFNDHYLEVDYDLSDVMFICTANTMNIPGPLLDRMEIIRIPGYTEDEKLNIANRYLIPKQIKNNGLKKVELTIDDEAVLSVIRYYTREAGVRELERQFAKLCRKLVKENTLSKNTQTVAVTDENLEHYLGVQRYKYGRAEEENQIGQVTGLAWTQVGGELLTIEAVAMQGKGKVVSTGSLGDVMQESIQAARTVVRSRAESLGIDAEFHESTDIHIHVPEGATPKDGPSAGVGMCTALVSVLTDIPVRSDVAMTGEITLRGQVLPIGGLKEKLLAAHRGGISTVLIPDENLRDLKEIPDNIKDELDIIPVKWIDEVLSIALERTPKPLPKKRGTTKSASGSGKKTARAGAKKQISTH